MTLRDRYAALMNDLVEERQGAVEGSWWAARLDQKIADLKAATEEKFTAGLKPLWAPGSPKEEVISDESNSPLV